VIGHLLRDGFLVLLLLNGLRVTIGVPPVSYWFRSHACPTCNGVGHVRDELRAPPPGFVRVTRDGQSTVVMVEDALRVLSPEAAQATERAEA
jgi:hypothetical protein